MEIHGSRDGGAIDAIMLEFPTEIRIEATEEERFTFGVKLANTSLGTIVFSLKPVW